LELNCLESCTVPAPSKRHSARRPVPDRAAQSALRGCRAGDLRGDNGCKADDERFEGTTQGPPVLDALRWKATG